MALITLDEAKEYLRVDSSDEDSVIGSLLAAAENLCIDVARLSEEQWSLIINNPPEENCVEKDTLKVAILYALGYLYEHREEADHHGLLLTLRSILFSIREGVI